MKSLAILTVCISFISVAQANEGLNLKYPELHVTPSASDRLKMEAPKERSSNRWYNRHTAIQASALTSLLAATYYKENLPEFDSNEWDTQQDYDDDISSAESSADLLRMHSAVWLGVTAFMSYKYNPYSRGHAKIKKMPANTKRERLTRERLAEEHLYGAYKVAQRMTWLYSITNIVLSAQLMDVADQGRDELKAAVAVSAITSLLPFLYKYRAIEVYDQHQKYKKRIYGPVATPGMVADSRGGLGPGVIFSMNF